MGKPAPRSQRTLALKRIDDALASFMAQRGGGEHALLNRLWEHWAMVLGPDLACLGSPLGHRKDVLLIAAEDSMAAQDLAMQADEILLRVNAFMESPYFARVQIELSMGRTDLSGLVPELRPAPPDLPLPRPDALGALEGQLEPTSPVAQCYQAYLRYFARVTSIG